MKRKPKKYKVFRAVTGLGLRATKPFKKGEQVVEYTGRRLTTAEADASPNRYLFEVDKDYTIDGSARTNLARYINHSCQPNCEAVLYEETGKIFIETKRKIQPGEELTFDYGTDHFDEYIAPIGCQCAHCLKKD